MQNEPYPTEITAAESALGFQKLLVDEIGDPMGSRIQIIPVPVVVKILDSSDAIFKIYDLNGKVTYSHRRWGRDKHSTPDEHRSWYPIHTPIPDPSLLIENFYAEHLKGMFEEEISGFPFRYRAA